MTDNPKTIPPPDWAEVWGRIPYNPNAERAAFNATTNGPTSAIPKDHGQPAPAVPVSTSGNVRPLQPPPGINLIDAICVAADQRERQQAQAPDMLAQAMTMMMQQQSTMLALLAQIVTNLESGTAKSAKPKAGGSK